MSGYVYIMASKKNGTIYTGDTSDLQGRVWEHRNDIYPGFTSKYGCKTLVWFEHLENITIAIKREKAVKKHLRKRKIELIENANPKWEDLFDQIYN
ncbi:MAG: GIY-YIG nuclease family protein [Rhizobiaceae bacterium]